VFLNNETKVNITVVHHTTCKFISVYLGNLGDYFGIHAAGRWKGHL